jgi:hypothetical protein
MARPKSRQWYHWFFSLWFCRRRNLFIWSRLTRLIESLIQFSRLNHSFHHPFSRRLRDGCFWCFEGRLGIGSVAQEHLVKSMPFDFHNWTLWRFGTLCFVIREEGCFIFFYASETHITWQLVSSSLQSDFETYLCSAMVWAQLLKYSRWCDFV